MANDKNIIIDRKKKRYYLGMDQTWDDPMGVDKAKTEKATQIPVDPKSINPIHKFLINHQPKDLLNHTVWCIKSDMSKTYEGRVVDVIPPDLIMVKCNNNNLVMTFSSVISIGDK